jgi:hypothetical protein
MLSKKALTEFKEIYFKEYGVTLSNKDATKKAIKILVLMRAVYRPLKSKTIWNR